MEREIQLKREVEHLLTENRVLKEKLEFYTDKYGIPDSFGDYKPTTSEKPKPQNQQNLININESKTNSEIYKKLVDESIRDLLMIQLNEILEMMANQNKQTVTTYNIMTKLKEQLKDK